MIGGFSPDHTVLDYEFNEIDVASIR